MKTPLDKFKMTSALAKRLAESMWGTGGTTAYQTTHKGIYSFSCSSHGGYIVAPDALTPKQLANIDARKNVHYKEDLALLVQTTTEGDVVIAIRSPYARTYKAVYNSNDGPVRWVNWEFYAFEEDCMWAVLEYEVGVRDLNSLKAEGKDEAKYAEDVARILTCYYPKGR